MNGRVYIVNRAGAGKTEQERVMCFDAEEGALHWEHRFNVFLTDIPSNRVGWASPVGDPETGYVYVNGVQGTFLCLDRDGKVLWERSLHEEYGTVSGYGGRVNTPIVDGDLAIISSLNSSWGAQGKGGHRYVAFDKRTGAVAWWAEPGEKPLDTTYSTPVVAVVNGVRLLIDGNGDGGIYAMKARTGEKVWGFKLSERGINASVVFWKNKVYACHSEENIDSTAMGRVVCIDATGKGDVTKTHEKWRIDGLPAGYSSPAIHEGKLYLFDNFANLHAIDAETGKILWKHSVGTVMKASPVLADGKIYVSEVNSRFVILKPGETSCETLCETIFPSPDGKVIEMNGSPAVSKGRVYFTTRDEIYCIGLVPWKGTDGAVPPLPAEESPSPDGARAALRITPADVVLGPGESVVFAGKGYDKRGRLLGSCQPKWSVKGLKGAISDGGKLTLTEDAGFGAGTVEGRLESIAVEARVRVVPKIPFSIDFEKVEEGKPPPGWIGAGGKFAVASLDDQKVLRKINNDARFVDAETLIGLPAMANYTIAADVRGTEARRQLPNIGLINSRYSLIIMGNEDRLKIASWISTPSRIDQRVSFNLKPNTWYRMKLRVEVEREKGIARGKVWPREEPEPEAWMVEVEDPVPHPSGAPGLQAYSSGVTARSPGAEVYFDNIQVTKN
jgi:outer membrane protein assembly factor BamB